MNRSIQKRVPIVKLIQENMDSIALAINQKEMLKSFNEQEDIEDMLKQYIKEEIETAKGRMKVVLEKILTTIERIDEVQDQQIEKIINASKIIAHINRLSNEILRPLDVNYKPKRTQLPLIAARVGIPHLKGGYWNEEDHMEKAPLRKER